VNRIEITGGTLVLNDGLFTKREILPSEIVTWKVYPEMGFDVIEITLKNGDLLRKTDEYNDLVNGLRALAGDKEIIE